MQSLLENLEIDGARLRGILIGEAVQVAGLGFGVSGLGFRVWGLGFRV